MNKKTLDKTFSLRINSETYKQLKIVAAKEDRSINYMTLTAIKELIARSK